MSFLYHASPIPGIQTLEPRISNHGIPRVYFSRKRENVLVYLCNAIEKYCKETHFPYTGSWQKWGPYGFRSDGILRLEEYYPHALFDTYHGASGYIYVAQETPEMEVLPDIRDAVVSSTAVSVLRCEYISDAYAEIISAYRRGLIDLLQYENTSAKWRGQTEQMILQEYAGANDHPEYQHFLRGKFPWLTF